MGMGANVYLVGLLNYDYQQSTPQYVKNFGGIDHIQKFYEAVDNFAN